MPDDLDHTKKLLEIEYAQVRSRINDMGDTRFKLKGWAVVLSTGLLALGVNRGQRWIILLCVPAAVLLFLVETDYLIRQEALQRRSDELEEVMESLRRPGPHSRADAYVFGLGAVSRQGYAGRGLPPMFGSFSRAGWAYLTIAVVAIVAFLLSS